MAAQLGARVVQGLVESTPRRVQALGEHVDRDAVQRKSDDDSPLVRRQDVGDRLLQGADQLALLDRLVRLDAGARKEAPRLRLERDLPALPGAPPELDRSFEQRELVRPRREPARAAEARGAARPPRRARGRSLAASAATPATRDRAPSQRRTWVKWWSCSRPSRSAQ